MQRKIAQDLSLRQKARRAVNFGGKGVEALSPAFKKIIRNMDRLDKKVRKEAEELNYFIGMAKSFARRRDYLTSATWLVKFHEKARTINFDVAQFDADVSKDQQSFLLKNFRGRDKDKLFSYDPTKDADDGKFATAGVTQNLKDWWKIPSKFQDTVHRLTDRKSQSMKALQRSFSVPFFKGLKGDTSDMVRTTSEFYQELLQHYAAMGKAWSTRNVGEYVSAIKQLEGSYKPYHAAFLKYHEKNIVPLKEAQAKIDEEEKTRQTEMGIASPVVAPSPFSTESDPFPARPAGTRDDIGGLRDGGVPLSEEPASSQSKDVVFSAPAAKKGPPPLPSWYRDHAPSAGVLAQPNPSIGKIDKNWEDEHEIASPKTQPSPRGVSEPFGKAPSFTGQRVAPAFQAAPSYKAPATKIFDDQAPLTQRSPGNAMPPSAAMPSTPRQMGPIPGNPTEIFLDPITKRPVSLPVPPVKPLPNVPTERFPYFNNTSPKRRELAHSDFLEKIEVLSSEADIIKEILRYSEELEQHSEENSLKLLAVVEGMIEKTAAPRKKKDLTPTPESIPETIVDEADIFPDDTPDTDRSPIAGNPLDALRTHDGLSPVNHGIPTGKVEKKWTDLPFLAKLRPSDIQLSSGTTNVLLKRLMKHFYHNYIPLDKIENYQGKLIALIKQSLSSGQVVSNMSCSDRHNPRDCQIEVFSFINLGDLDPYFSGQKLSFTLSLRLSVMDGTVAVRTINTPKLHGE